jgi:hypothetical protein
MVTRRSVLRAVGIAGIAGLAGCTAQTNDLPVADGGTNDGDGTGSQPSELEHPPDARIVAQDPAPELPVAPQVSLADPYVTGGSPPVLRVDVDNTSDAPVVLGEYRAVVFQYVHGGSDGELMLLPHSERSTEGEPDRTTPEYEVEGEGCWRLSSGMAITQEYGTVEVPVGGTLTAFVGLYGLPGNENGNAEDGDCLPTGEHRFEATYSYYPDGLGGDDREDAAWGFTLSLERIEDAE